MSGHASNRVAGSFGRRGLLSFLACLWLAMPCGAQAQWPEGVGTTHRNDIPWFRAAWTTGERTMERLAASAKVGNELALVEKRLITGSKSIRWLRSTRMVSKPL